MGRLDRHIEQQRATGGAMADSNRRLAEAHARSRAISQEFIDRMQSRQIGTTALFGITSTPIMQPRWFSEPRNTGRSSHKYDLLGRGWVIDECAPDYERTPTNWIVLEDNRIIMCSPIITKTTFEKHPEYPYVIKRGNSLEDAAVPLPFHSERAIDWLAQAAIRLGA